MNKIKITAILLIMALCASMLYACGDDESGGNDGGSSGGKNSAVEYNLGKISGNTYTNDFFKVEMNFPEGFTLEAMDISEVMAEEELDEEELDQMSMFDILVVGNAAPKDGDEYGEFGIIVYAHKVTDIKGYDIKNEEDYLTFYRTEMDTSDYSSPEQVKIGGKTFYKMVSTDDYTDYFDMISVDEFYAHKINDYVLSIYISYNDLDTDYRAIAEDFLNNNVKFN